jgi:hypothetical protein
MVMLFDRDVARRAVGNHFLSACGDGRERRAVRRRGADDIAVDRNRTDVVLDDDAGVPKEVSAGAVVGASDERAADEETGNARAADLAGVGQQGIGPGDGAAPHVARDPDGADVAAGDDLAGVTAVAADHRAANGDAHDTSVVVADRTAAQVAGNAHRADAIIRADPGVDD